MKCILKGALLIGFLAPASALAQDTTRTVTVGGFVDAYYAWDFNQPRNLDRSFTTQPARHNEFNVNLAFVELKLTAARVRGRLALQAGNSVQSNYAAEPTLGQISGPILSRHIQEAVVGFQPASALWVEGGIYLSHIGQESWISRDNPTYTRSLIADYSPYYETGVRAIWQASSKVTAQLHVLNGWQNIAENNREKAVGIRIDCAVSPIVTVGYANFLGDEAPDTVESRARFFNEVFASVRGSRASLWITADYGVQKRPTVGTSNWYGAALIGRVQAASKVAFSARVERYVDGDQVIVATGSPDGFRVSGASLGLDVTPVTNVLWRVEARGFRARDSIYAKDLNAFSRNDGMVVSSLSVTF